MNLPNKLTVMRAVLVPVFMLFISMPNFKFSYVIALCVFSVAAFTDFLDGNIARKHNIVTDFGKFMDPLSDKLLTTVALIYLIRFEMCNEVVLSIVLAREFAVSGIRMVAAAQGGGKVIAASMWGKVKTVVQMLSIILALAIISIAQITAETNITLLSSEILLAGVLLVNCLMWVMAILTIVSGLQYIIPNIDLIKNAK